MIKTRHLLASAPLAIIAMAALPSTPAAAQEAPVSVLGAPPTTAAAPAMVIVAPTPTVALPEAEPVDATPIVQATEPVATATPKRKTGSQPARTVTPRNAPAPDTPVASPVEPSADVRPAEPLAAEIVPEMTVSQAELPPPAPLEDASTIAMLLSLLGMGSLGLAAFLLFRSQSRKVRTVTLGKQSPIPRPTASMVIDSEPYVTTLDAQPPRIPAQDPVRPATPASTGAVELPVEPPRSEAERGRLIERMIAAKPDRANPFTSHKARAKRARLILQSIGTRFTDRKPGIDLSQYTNVWPELRGWRPATA